MKKFLKMLSHLLLQMIRLAQVYEHAKVILDITVLLFQFVFEIIYSLIKKVIKDRPKDISGEIVLVNSFPVRLFRIIHSNVCLNFFFKRLLGQDMASEKN